MAPIYRTIEGISEIRLPSSELDRLFGFKQLEESNMSKEKPKDDPRQATDWKTTKQTDEPWKGPIEKNDSSSLDLEKWQETNTH
jgi:hypothetical protein